MFKIQVAPTHRCKMSHRCTIGSLVAGALLGMMLLASCNSEARPLEVEQISAASNNNNMMLQNRDFASQSDAEDKDDDDEDRLAAAALQQSPSYQSSIVANSPNDLNTAASHHGHGVKGWLDMGAWTGKKGAFGWYDKHPVGKGKR